MSTQGSNYSTNEPRQGPTAQKTPQTSQPQPKLLRHDNTQQKKVNIFSMPQIFNPSPSTHPQPPNQHPNKPTISRQTLKKHLKMRAHQRPRTLRVKPKDLSLIHEQESIELFTSSESESLPQSGNYTDESEYLSEDGEGSQYWEKDKMNEGFLENQKEEDDSELDRTVMMTKKKPPRPIEAKRVVEQKADQLVIGLSQLLERFSIHQLHGFYEEGKIPKEHFKILLALDREKSIKAKQGKFNQNLQRIKREADIILRNFELFGQKLSKDVTSSETKLRDLTKTFIRLPKHQHTYDPQKIRLQLRIHQKASQLQAKTTLLHTLHSTSQQFHSTYLQQLTKLQSLFNPQTPKQATISQTLTFTQIKQLLKVGHQAYSGMLRSIKKSKETGRSQLNDIVRQLYVQKLEEKYQKELQQIGEDVMGGMLVIAEGVMERQGGEISQAVYRRIAEKVQRKMVVGLKNAQTLLHRNIAWVRMIRQDGQLQSGQIYTDAINLLQNYPSTQLSLEDHKEKALIDNFKFYRKTILKNLLKDVQPLSRLFMYFQSGKERRRFQANEKKLKKLVDGIRRNEKQTLMVGSILSRVMVQKKNGESKRIEESVERFSQIGKYLEEKWNNLSRIENKLPSLLEEKETRSIHRSLIPKTRVQVYDFCHQAAQINSHNLSSNKQTKQQAWQTIFTQMQKKKPLLQSPKYHQPHIPRQDLSTYSSDLNDNNHHQQFSQHSFKKEVQKILHESQSQKTSDQQETNKHLDRVYELLLKNRVAESGFEDHKEDSAEQPFELPYFDEYEYSLPSILLSGRKPAIDDSHLFLNLHPKTSDSQQSLQPNHHHSLQQHLPWLSPHQSNQEIEVACQIFVRYFYLHPRVREQLQLNDHQFMFLMSPQYRKQIMDKRVKDQQLTENILELIRHNSLPQPVSNTPTPNRLIDNPIKYMLHIDPHFQQRVDEYQQKIVKNLKHSTSSSSFLHDPYDCDDLLSTTTETKSEYGLLDRRLREMEDKRLGECWEEKYSLYHSRKGSEWTLGEDQRWFD